MGQSVVLWQYFTVKPRIFPVWPDRASTEPRRVGETDSTIRRVTWGFVGLGLAFGSGAYLLDFPLWWDEAFLAVNLLRRDFAGLLRPARLRPGLPAAVPLGGAGGVRILGFSEWSLRLFPLLCGLASVLAFRAVAAVRLLDGRAALVAVAVFAVVGPPDPPCGRPQAVLDSTSWSP